MIKTPIRIAIVGAGGRDFHNFNMVFRNNPIFKVEGFVLTQIPGIKLDRYPPNLAGELYPNGIDIVPEEKLEELVVSKKIDVVVLAFSDLTYKELGNMINRILSTGASFMIMGPSSTYLESNKPVLAITATRTGAGKSSVVRAVTKVMLEKGYKIAPIRHPMVYSNFKKVIVASSIEDLDRLGLTIEEREEFEHYVRAGLTVYAGVDYAEVLALAERNSDVILWDGGNNDWPFIKPDYMIVVADAMRPAYVVDSYPGGVNVRLADAVIINKVDRARPEDVKKLIDDIRSVNSKAKISLAVSKVYVDNPEEIAGKRVVVLEDAPTVTHGEAPYGAGYVAAEKYDCIIIDPRPYAVGWIAEAYKRYPHMGPVVPTLGYTPEQQRDLEETINRIPADVVVSGSPIDVSRVLRLNKPVVRVRYEIEIVSGPTIRDIVTEFLERVSTKLSERRIIP